MRAADPRDRRTSSSRTSSSRSGAALFRFEIPEGSFTPGLYPCQANVIDAAAGTFAFPRLAFYVRG